MVFSPERVHHYQPTRENNEVRLVRTTPYVRIKHGDEPPVFIQDNAFYWEGSEAIPIPEVPGWVWEHLERMNPKVLQEANFTHNVQEFLKKVRDPDGTLEETTKAAEARRATRRAAKAEKAPAVTEAKEPAPAAAVENSNTSEKKAKGWKSKAKK